MPSGYDFMLLINETDKSVQIRLKSHNIKTRSLLQARVCLVAAILNVKYVVNCGQPQYGMRNDRELLETLLAVILFLQMLERPSNLNKIPVLSAKKCFLFYFIIFFYKRPFKIRNTLSVEVWDREMFGNRSRSFPLLTIFFLQIEGLALYRVENFTTIIVEKISQ